MTQLSLAKEGKITPEMREVALQEGLPVEAILEGVRQGVMVIPKNAKRNFPARGIGRGLRTKVNANIGTSHFHCEPHEELEKLRVAEEAGADSVMDLSTGGDLDAIRKAVMESARVMVGTVPVYEIAAMPDALSATPDDFFEVIERHAFQGVDFVTVHAGVTERSLAALESQKRVLGIVSRGGAFTAAWMRKNRRENPLFEQFERLLKIAFEHDLTLSLGDGLRPGSVADATDRGQMEELLVIGELVRRARERGVQVMVEGPGHVPLDQIEANVLLEKRVCEGAPFYVLGPLPTDIAPGYDHITAAIGGAIAAAAGADFLCYVTSAEHLRLPTPEDVREGVIASRIAAHAADIAKGIKGSLERDMEMSKKRRKLDWEGMYRLAMGPEKARRMRMESEAYSEEVCTMCGKFCSISIDHSREG